MSAPRKLAGSLADAIRFDWRANARPEQLAPLGDWSNWLILAGRGFGKTRSGAEFVRENVCGKTPLAPGRYRHVALVAETAADGREVMVGDGRGPGEGSGLMSIHPKDFRPIYESSKRRLTWPNGAMATLYNATEPDQLRGPQHDFGWCDELCKWRLAQETWDQLAFGMRLGRKPRIIITTTPKPTKLLKSIMEDEFTVVTRGRTLDNSANLAPSFLKRIESMYGGTRLGRQELDAEILNDVPGALWSLSDIEETRVERIMVPDLKRIVVAVDPAVSNKPGSDETGIVAAGVDANGHAYVLADESGHYSPNEWARAAIRLYHRVGADRIVAEVNNGGALVETTLRAVDPSISYRAVHASRGKVARAEPVAALYEQRRVHHVEVFDKLEDQMVAFTSDFDRASAGYSPDRLDAAVWALTDLVITGRSPILYMF